MGTDLESKFTGALIGSAVGDALGAPVEGYSSERVSSMYEGEWELKSGRYTDDTEMMIGVAESLIENRGFNGMDMALKFITNYDMRRGYGPGSKEVLRRISAGESWTEASKKLFGGAGSYGNGAAMRIAPVGLFYHDNAAVLREIAYKSSQITHSHLLGKEGAAIQAYSVALAVQGVKEGMLSRLKEFVSVAAYKGKLLKLEQLLDMDPTKEAIIRELGHDVTAFNSVFSAIYSFSRFDNFKDAVIYAVSLGGDTDTIGAMTGAICGAFYGEGGIPSAWVEKLEEGEKGRSYIKNLGKMLYRLKY
ncbi:MAG: ADP-ribosylglycohydrolase family protein [Halobacteriota archaeon]